MKIRIGIDIGSKGAIAFFADGKLRSYYALPLVEDRPDLLSFVELILGNITTDDDVHVAMEDLHSVFGSGANSNFQFGWINGATEAICTTLSLPYTKIGPKKWQKEIWQGIRPVEVVAKEKKKKGEPAEPKRDKNGNIKYKVDTKATSLLAAKRLFPDETFLATLRSKVPHDGIVDAVLIGEYCKRHF